MIEIKIENRIIRYAESWNELTRDQLLILSRLFTQRLSIGDFKLRAVIHFLRIGKHLVNYRDSTYFAEGIYRILPLPLLLKRGIRKGKVKLFDNADAWVLAETMNWLFDSPDEDAQIKNTLTKNLLPTVKVPGRIPFIRRKLYGAKSDLADLIGIEFARADANYLAYVQTNDDKYLNNLIGILYRPRKRFYWIKKLVLGDVNSPRASYTDHQADKLSNIAQKLSLETRYAIFLFFQGCRNDLSKKYPLVFAASDSDHTDSSGWAGVFRMLTNERIADVNKVMELYIHTILFDLNEKIKIGKQNKNKTQ